MTYEPTRAQRAVIEARDPVLLVLGGAGTGKTATAAAASREHLIDQDRRRPAGSPLPRVLFLSFSRASVSQIVSRTADALGPYRERVEVTTFHGLAWRLVQRYGLALGRGELRLLGEAEGRLFPNASSLGYGDLLPLALQAAALPAAAAHLQQRWGLIVCDEFQDTSDDQFRLLLAVRGTARLLLLGDPNQCIYTNLPGAAGVGPERLAAALALAGARSIKLPEASHRDPTGVLPAAAAAIRRREFTHPAVQVALTSNRLEVHAGLDPATEAAQVADAVARLRGLGSVAVFSHHVDTTTLLSDQLLSQGVGHEVVGLPESLTSALDAQQALLAFAAGTVSWSSSLDRLAVFVTSSVRGKKVPELARMFLGQVAFPCALARRLEELRVALDNAQLDEAAALAAAAHGALGLTHGGHTWDRAARLLAPMLRTSQRGIANPRVVAGRLEQQVTQRRDALLTSEASEFQHQVQLMGLYQSKGREADSTVVVLRDSDFFGAERSEPFDVGSKLLYVLYTRARSRTVTLAFGRDLHPLIAPLSRLRCAADR